MYAAIQHTPINERIADALKSETTLKTKNGFVIEYVVFKEHGIGFLSQDKLGIWLSLLASKKQFFGVVADVVMIGTADAKHVRKATKEDFKDYRVQCTSYNLG